MLNHNNRIKTGYWLTLITLGLSLAGCGSNNQGTTQGKDKDGTAGTVGGGTALTDAAEGDLKEVRVGYLANIVMPQPLVGFQNGEFEKLVPGVTFNAKDFPAGPAVLEQLRAGTIDIAYTGPYPPMKAYAKDKDVVLLAGAAKGGTGLMVSKDSPIKSVAELKGKKVGINQLGSTVDAMVRYNLLEAGLDPARDVKLIEVKPAEQANYLQSGLVAAVAAPAPWPSFVEVNSNARPLLDWKQILDNGNYLSAVVFTTRKFADANPAFIKKFVAAHKAITDRLNKDRTRGNAEVLAAWSKITKKKLDPAVAKAAFATIEFTNEADLETFKRDMDIAVKVGILKQAGDLTGFVYSQ